MRNGIMNEIRAEYEALRAGNQREEMRRRDEVTAADPEIERLDALRWKMLRSALRNALDGRGEDAQQGETLRGEIEQINLKIRERLIQGGFSEDYLQPIYACDRCHDTGFVGETIQSRCDCLARRLRDHLYAEADHGLNRAETFASFNAAVYPESPLEGGAGTQREYMARMRDRCFAYADSYPNTSHRNLLLLGMSGLGKTYLMNCIGNQLLARGFEVRKITAYQLSERMRASIFESNPEAFSQLLSVPVLMLDDLGAEPLINNITIECLFTLLNERDLKGLHTLISTNLSALELTRRYTERVCSRLFSKKSTAMLLFQGKDVRLHSV